MNRKELGELAISPSVVTAGEEVDFTLTYKVTEAMKATDVIEIKLPADWDAPKAYNFNDDDKHADADGNLLKDVILKDVKGQHVYLSGSPSRFRDFEIEVIDVGGTPFYDEDQIGRGESWFVQVTVGGENDVANGSTIVLKYNDVTVQPTLATGDDKLKIETFSGPEVPQFPVVEMAKDTIEVKHAKDGSGEVTFMYGGERCNEYEW